MIVLSVATWKIPNNICKIINKPSSSRSCGVSYKKRERVLFDMRFPSKDASTWFGGTFFLARIICRVSSGCVTHYWYTSVSCRSDRKRETLRRCDGRAPDPAIVARQRSLCYASSPLRLFWWSDDRRPASLTPVIRTNIMLKYI